MNPIQFTLCVISSFILVQPFTFAQEMRWIEFLNKAENSLNSTDYTVRVDAVRSFKTQDNRDAADYLIDLMLKKKEHPWVRETASQVLGEYKSEIAKNLVFNEIRRQRIPNIYLLNAYIAHGHDDALDRTVEIIETSRNNTVVAGAINALVNIDGPFDDQLISHIAGFLEDNHFHHVRRAAASTLGALPSRSAFQPLLANIEDQVIGDTARASLLRLTGQEFWRDHHQWTLWWQANKDTFKPQPLDDTTFVEKFEKLLELKGENQVPDFYEREFTGKNIILILDVSGSMKFKTQNGTRLEVMQTEIYGLLDSLDSQYSIGFVSFPHEVFPKRGIKKVDDRFRKSAKTFIEGIYAEGGTPLWGALKHTYDRLVEQENIDTIYLLSDGDPTDSTGPQIIKGVLGFNEQFGVKINTISIGAESDFLAELAELTGGDYWSFK